MKIIVSHDVDHLSVKEHFFRDLIIPKFFVLQLIELLKGNISFRELFLRYKEVIKNDWNHLKDLQNFNIKNNVKATYFFGMDNALGLSYNQKDAAKGINYLLENGADVGVHGINYENKNLLEKELKSFQKISGLKEVGIRMHYLRQNKNTQNYLSSIGYTFDVTDYVEDGYNISKIGNMCILPFQAMDTYMFSFNRKSYSYEEALDDTIRLLNKSIKNGNKYFSILIHQRHFSEGFKSWRDWYIGFIKYCNEKGYEFINYKDFIKG